MQRSQIVNLLKTYSNLNFILIGDAGEKDADIYMEVVSNYPNRINAIYLRSVKSSKRMNRIKNLIKNYTETSFLLVDSSKQAIKHAKENGFIKA